MGEDIAKRSLDVVLGLLLLAVALPAIILGAVGTAISLRAWPFFTQQRIGRGGRPFRFVKLRTLPVHAPRYAGKYEISHLELPRFTQFLRHYHLDELPQILLVFTGHMSLVGPRPEMPHLHAQLQHDVALRRTSVRPGCTGLWQVGEHCGAMIDEHPEFDDHYLGHRSVRLDLWILARTARLLMPFSTTSLVTLSDLPSWAGGPVSARAGSPLVVATSGGERPVADGLVAVRGLTHGLVRTFGRRSTRTRVLLWSAGLLIIVALVVGAAAVRVAVSGSRLEEAEDLIDDAATALEDGRLADARAALRSAEVLVVEANNGLYTSLEVQLADRLPGIRQNLESLRESVALASSIIHGGRQILDESIPLESAEGKLEVSLSDGTIPLDAVRGALREIEALSVRLPTAPLEDGGPFMLERTERLRTAVHVEAVRRRAQLDVLREGLNLLLELAGADAPRRYLLAVANTAEMRGAGGMILNYGILEGDDGVIDLTEFGRVDELFLENAVPETAIDVPDDFTRRWSGFEPTRLWRSANVAADFTLSAPILEALYEHATVSRIDGVIQVDPQGLAAILTSVGPIVVPELGEVNAENVERLVLNEAYQRFPGIEERSDVLGDVAEGAFRRLVDGEFPSLRPLAEAVGEAVEGRHILFHSRSPSVDSSGAYFSASGELPAPDRLDWAHLTVQNISANKLDYYLDTALLLTGERLDGRVGHLQAELVISNTAPPGATEPGYIFGPYNELQEPGLYRGLVTLYLPNGTSLVDHEGGLLRSEPITQTEGGRTLVSFLVDIPAGEERRVVLDLQLAPVAASVPYDLTLVPSPRVRPTQVTVEVATDAGLITAERSLDRTYVLRPGADP